MSKDLFVRDGWKTRKINLQLFAGTTDEGEGDQDFELDDEGEGIEIDLDDFELDDDQEGDDQEGDDQGEKDKGKEKPDTEKPGKEKEKGKDKMVPLSALEAERKKWQKKVDELKKGKGTPAPADDETPDLTKALTDAGFDEKTIKALSKVLGKTEGKTSNVEKLVNKRFRDLEFKELAKSPLYSDIEDYREDIEEIAEKSGLSVEEVYLAKYGKQKLLGSRQDIEREVEQRVLNNIKKRNGQRIDTTPNGDVDTKMKRLNLTKDEMDMARLAGMSPEEFAASKSAKSLDKLDKYFGKKKG